MLLLTICLIFVPKSLKYIHITIIFYSKPSPSYNCKLTGVCVSGCSITLPNPIKNGGPENQASGLIPEMVLLFF